MHITLNTKVLAPFGKIIVTAIAFSFLHIGSANAIALDSRSFEYGTDLKFEGYLSQPAVKSKNKKLPGLLVVHNWMGVTAETKKQSDRLAQLGYLVFAVDIYGKGVRPQNPKEAGELATQYKSNRKMFRDRLNSGLAALSSLPNVDTSKIVALGYCFGGTGVVELARSGADVKAVISFHGGLDGPKTDAGNSWKAKVLAFHGAIDPFVPEKDLLAFEDEMKRNKVDFQLFKFGNTVHSFTEESAGNDPTKGFAYSASSDKRSFEITKNFLAEIL